MKKTLLISLAAAAVVFSGCDFKNLAVPETVSVKTAANYEFTVAKMDSKKQSWLDISSMLDFGKMIGGEEGEGESEEQEGKFKLLKYNDGSDYQQFLMHMPLKTIDFDFSESFSKMEFASSMEGFDFQRSFEVPSLNYSDEKTLNLDSIKAAINTSVTLYDPDDPEKYKTYSEILVQFEGFDTVKYKEGTFVILTTTDYDGSVSLYDGDTELCTATFTGNTANLNISNKTIKKNMKLKFTGPANVPFTASVAPSSKIKKATGITLDSSLFSVQPVNLSFPLTIPGIIDNCTINTGSITVKIEKPAGWSDGIISNYNIAISGGLTATITKTNPTYSLNGQSLADSDINANATVTIVLNDAEIDFDNEPKVNVAIAVSKVTAEVEPPAGFNSHIEQDPPQTIGADIAKYIEQITWSKAGLKVTAKNTLPAIASNPDANKITLDFASDFLGLTSSPWGVAAGGDSADFVTHVFEGAETKQVDITESTPLDFEGTVTLPGYTNVHKKFIATEIVPGKEYVISLKVEPVLNWSEAKVKMDSTDLSFDGAFETNINKEDLFKTFGDSFVSNFADKISFTSMPLYIFATKPDLDIFEDAQYEGVVKVYYGKKANESDPKPTMGAGSGVEYLIGEADPGNPDVPAAIVFRSMPELVKNAKDEVTTKFNYADRTFDFKNAFDITPSTEEGTSLCLDYNVAFGGGGGGSAVTITKQQMDELKVNGKTSISIDIVMLLAMQFDLKDTISIDIRELIQSGEAPDPATMTDKDRDLLGREDGSDTAALENYIDYIKSASIQLKNPKFPIKSTGGVALVIKWNDQTQEQKCMIKDGVDTVLEVNPRALLTYPLDPQIKLVIGKGSFGLPKDMSIESTLKLCVKVQGEIPVYPFNAGGTN